MEISRAHQTPVESAHWPFGQYRIREVKSLGNSLLAAMKKEDGEAMTEDWTLDNPNCSGEPSTVLQVIDFGRTEAPSESLCC